MSLYGEGVARVSTQSGGWTEFVNHVLPFQVTQNHEGRVNNDSNDLRVLARTKDRLCLEGFVVGRTRPCVAAGILNRVHHLLQYRS